MAAQGVPMRTLQEMMGHRDFKTTLIYADYAPSAREAEWARLHADELAANWERGRAEEPLLAIDPLP
jgi:integrase